MNKTAPGFSLIEVLIVILIMSILGAVTFVTFVPVKRKAQARAAVRKTDIGQLVNALKAYYTVKDTFPSPSGPASTSGMTELRVSGDLRLIPLDPAGNEYQYLVSGSGVTSKAALYGVLEKPTSTGKKNDIFVWCWRSEGSLIQEQLEKDCVP